MFYSDKLGGSEAKPICTSLNQEPLYWRNGKIEKIFLPEPLNLSDQKGE
jgi:hypothetical protein